MLEWAVRPVWAETKRKVPAYVSLHVAHWAVHRLDLAEPKVEVGTVFVFPVPSWGLMPIHALLALQAVAILLEVSADWHPVLFVHVQVLALLPPLALLLQPVHAHYFLELRLVSLQVLRLVERNQLVEARDVHFSLFCKFNYCHCQIEFSKYFYLKKIRQKLNLAQSNLSHH